MNLNMKLLRGIYAYGFEKPSKIQSCGIVPITKGYDIIGQSQSGTGKTGTFLIGTLNNIDPDLKKTQALILAPTRELSQQLLRWVGRHAEHRHEHRQGLCASKTSTRHATPK